MRILILSDLHLEFGAPLVVPEGAAFDAVVLAGDIHNPGYKAVDWAKSQKAFGDRPVFLVPGNHEFYGSEIFAEWQRMRASAKGSNVRVLGRGVSIHGGVRFVGCILWTDFALPVGPVGGVGESNTKRALREAGARLNDFRRIDLWTRHYGLDKYRNLRRQLLPVDTLVMHRSEREWLWDTLEEPFDGKTVVITHHAPSIQSVAPRYANDWLTPSFVSDLPNDLFNVPALWVHGHTHTSFDYLRQTCRVVSNPRGYPVGGGAFENAQFKPNYVVDLAAPLRIVSETGGRPDAETL